MDPLEIVVVALGALLALAAYLLVAGARDLAGAKECARRDLANAHGLAVELRAAHAELGELRRWREMLTAICRRTGIAIPEDLGGARPDVSADTSTAWARGTLYDVATSVPSLIKVPSTTTEAEAPAA